MAAGETHDQLELIAPSGQVRFFDLDPTRGVANIGRHPDNDIVLDSPSISPFLAVLDYHAKPYQLIWLDNATRPPRELNTYDLVQLDGYSLVVVSSDAAVPAALPAAVAANAAPLPATPAAEASTTMAVTTLPAEAALPALPVIEMTEAAAPSTGAPSDEFEMDLDMLDAILMATEAQKDDVILVEVQTLAGDAEKKDTGDLDLSIAAGQTASLEATITNGGDVVAAFDVTLPGIPLDWVSISPARVNLKEGGRVSVLISITPPRKASVRARGYFYSVVVRSPEYPERLSSSPGMLVVQPFYQFSVGSLDPRQQTIPYSRRSGLAILPVVNQGNSEAAFRVEGEDDRRLCRFEFEVPGEAVALATRAEVRVPPEQTLPVHMHIIPTKRLLVGLGRVNHPFTVTVTPLDVRQTPRSVLGQVQTAPLIGPIPIVLLALLLVLLFVILYRPAIYNFTASSPAISAGETVALTWKAKQFSGLRLDPGGLTLAGIQGTVVLAPAQDTLYTLTADNLLSRLAPKWFQATRQVRVNVSAVLPAFRQFSADRNVVTIGESVNLAWDVARADSLTLIINGAAETLLPKEYIGNRTLKLDKKTTVQLVAVNAYTPPEGVSRSLVLEVQPVPPVIPPPPVIKRFDITPQEVVAGQVVMLNWEVTGVAKVTITGIGELPANGSVSVAPPNDTIYTLTAANGMPDGSVSREQRVSVRPAPTPTPIPGTPKIEFIKATPADAILGSPEASAVKLTWQVTGDVTNIEISGTGTTSKSSGLPKTGTLTVAVDKQTLFILTAYNGNLSASQTVQVTVSNPVPVANSLEPTLTEATGGTAGLVLVVNGANFNKDSKVRVSGTDRSTTFINTSRLSAALLPDDVKSAGTLNVVIYTPTPGGGTSSLLTLTIINPRPVISQVSPPFLFKGGAGTTIFVTGLGFVTADSKVYYGSTQRPTTFINNTQLSAALTAQDLTAAGSISITVRNPGPGGVAFVSNAVDFQVKAEYPLPELLSISPLQAPVGGQGFTLWITGTNNTFVRDTTLINWQGTYLPNVVYSDTNHLSVFVTADQLPTETGTVNVSAVNPTPGGGQSNIITFAMTSPTLAISPSPVTATVLTDPTKAIQVTLSAAQRGATTIALVSSSPSAISVPTSVVIPAGSTSAIFTATAGLVATSQAITLTATLPATLGNRSTTGLVYVRNPAPSLSATPLNPSTRVYQSSGFTLQVTGVNFLPTSVVYWNGSSRPTTYVSSTQLNANISASDMATGGAVNVTVFNPLPGGGLSGPAAFNIQYRLSVSNQRPSYGSIVSTNRAGISCGTTCQALVDSATSPSFVLEAQPLSGFAFNGWGGDCSGMGYTCTVPMTRNRTVYSYFDQAYTLTLSRSGLGRVSTTPPGLDTNSCPACTTFTAPFIRRATVYLLAEATANTRFTGWGGACSSAGASPYCTVHMNSDTSVSATFVPVYWLTVAKLGSGLGRISSDALGIDCGSYCQASYTSGTTLILTAAPVTPTTAIFTGWGGTCATFGTSPTCTLTIGTADISDVTATFTPIWAVNLSKRLTIAPTGGTVTGASTPVQTNIVCDGACTSETLTYRDNTSLTLTAAPDLAPGLGYAFLGWNIPSCGTSSTCALTVTADRNIVANFQPLYSLSIALSGSGSVTGLNNSPIVYPNINCGTTCGPINYPATTTITLTATPNTGYIFTGWTGGTCGASPTTNPCVVTIAGTEAITATFAPFYTLTVAPTNANGSVSSTAPDTQIATCTNAGGPNCAGDYVSGSNITLVAAPTANYHVSAWSLPACGTNTTCIVSNLTANLTVAITFTIDARTLTITPDANGSLSSTSPDTQISLCTTTGGTCTGTYNHGDVVTLQATAAPGYYVTGWTGTGGAGCGAATTCAVTMNTDRTVAATYAINMYAVTVAPSGLGSVASTDTAINNCTSTGGTCSSNYAYSSTVTLQATPTLTTVVTGWTINSVSSCGTATTCAVPNIAGATNVTVDFTVITYTLSITTSVPTSGTVTASGSWGSINCPGTCTASAINASTVVPLLATRSGGATRIQWLGNCASGGTITTTTSTYNLNMTANQSCTVNFLP